MLHVECTPELMSDLTARDSLPQESAQFSGLSG